MAKALGLCQKADVPHWGVVSATYTNGYGSSTPPRPRFSTGILPKFGNVLKPRQGASFGVLASGARARVRPVQDSRRALQRWLLDADDPERRAGGSPRLSVVSAAKHVRRP